MALNAGKLEIVKRLINHPGICPMIRVHCKTILLANSIKEYLTFFP